MSRYYWQIQRQSSHGFWASVQDRQYLASQDNIYVISYPVLRALDSMGTLPLAENFKSRAKEFTSKNPLFLNRKGGYKLSVHIALKMLFDQYYSYQNEEGLLVDYDAIYHHMVHEEAYDYAEYIARNIVSNGDIPYDKCYNVLERFTRELYIRQTQSLYQARFQGARENSSELFRLVEEHLQNMVTLQKKLCRFSEYHFEAFTRLMGEQLKPSCQMLEQLAYCKIRDQYNAVKKEWEMFKHSVMSIGGGTFRENALSYEGHVLSSSFLITINDSGRGRAIINGVKNKLNYWWA